MYTDDTTIYFNLEDFPALNREQDINKELEKLNTWFQLNKLTLNYMLFHKRRAVSPINISMNNIPINISTFQLSGYHTGYTFIVENACCDGHWET